MPEIGHVSAYDEFQNKFGYVPPEILRFVDSTVLRHETNNLLFVHGGYELPWISTSANKIPEQQCLWAYKVAATWQGKKIVRGHSLVDQPEEWNNHISCEAGGWLPERPLVLPIVSDWKRTNKLRGHIEINSKSQRLVLTGNK